MVNEKQDSDFIIERCKLLINMARDDNWDGFEDKLYERDVAINKNYGDVDVMKMTVSEKNDFDTIRRLNDDIKSIVLEKQKIIKKTLLVGNQGNKAQRAYQQR